MRSPDTPGGRATMAVTTAGRTGVIMVGTRAANADGTTLITTGIIAVRATDITVIKPIIRITVTRHITRTMVTAVAGTASDRRY